MGIGVTGEAGFIGARGEEGETVTLYYSLNPDLQQPRDDGVASDTYWSSLPIGTS